MSRCAFFHGQNNKQPYLKAPSSVLADPLGGISFVNIISNIEFNVVVIEDLTGLVEGRDTTAWGTGMCIINIASTHQIQQSRYALIELQPVNSTLPAVTINFSQTGSLKSS